jgi:uncharacterized membrane protein
VTIPAAEAKNVPHLLRQAFTMSLASRPAASTIARRCATPEYAHTARRNNSMSARGRRAFFWITVAVMLTIGGYCLILGAWPVVVFAGLDLALLYCAMSYLEVHADDYERVTLQAGTVSVEVREAGRITVEDFNRYWIRLAYDAATCRVKLRSHGREIELGKHLCPDKRKAWHAELARALSRTPEMDPDRSGRIGR